MNEITITLNLILAAVFGGVIGYFREKERKAAGFRTHMLVCVGSTLVMMISIFIGTNYQGADVGRIASSVVTGIGFICAGTILRERGTVTGLTTAASVWLVSGIGLAVGCNFYFAATITTILALIILIIIHEIEKKYVRTEEHRG